MKPEIEITTEQSERLKELVPPMLDRAFNEGIDKAIDIVDEARDLEAVTKNEELFLDAIVQRLNQLKK